MEPYSSCDKIRQVGRVFEFSEAFGCFRMLYDAVCLVMFQNVVVGEQIWDKDG